MRILFVLFLSLVSFAVQAREYVGHRLDNGSLRVQADDGELRLSFLSPWAVDITFTPTGGDLHRSYSLKPELVPVTGTLTETPTSLIFSQQGLEAVLDKQSMLLSYSSEGRHLVSEQAGLMSEPRQVSVAFSMSNGEKIMGGGQRILGMDRRGRRLPLYNKPAWVEDETFEANFSMPGYVSSNKYLLLYDNAAKGTMDIGASDPDVLRFESVGGRSGYYVVAAPSYQGIVEHFTALTGRQPMPPRWAMGYIASRFGYHSEREVRDTIATFDQYDWPVDAVVIDLYWFGKDIQGHMGKLDWDKEFWPTPIGMMDDLRGKGVNTILITEPYILTTSDRWESAVQADVIAKNDKGEPYRFDFYFGNTGLLDMFDPKAKAWFWKIYQQHTDTGVAGWWGDLGEPEVHPDDIVHVDGLGDEVHNAYGHEWAQAVYDNWTKTYPDRSLFLLMRAGFAGSQRYGMIPWTGDVKRGWDGLWPQVELNLQMGLFGMAFQHSDLGGFATENWVPEAYTRWLQYGVFQPIYRPHGIEPIAPEPVFHDASIRENLRRYVNLRYRLMPYNYTLAHEAEALGLPLVRPLFFQQDAPELIDVRDTFMWGDAILVSPVTAPGVDQWPVTLPEGAWINYWTGDVYRGNGVQNVPVDIDTLPILVKAGSFIPMVEDVMIAKDYTSEKLTVHYYHHPEVKAAEGYMYEDDGQTAGAYARGAFEKLIFKAGFAADKGLALSFTAERGGELVADGMERTLRDWFGLSPGVVYTGMPEQREIQLVVHNIDAAQSVLIDGEAVAGEYDANAKQLTVRFEWDHSRKIVMIK
jgi:oligosaccharide 4-alpha-D-glucosyltransferase